MATIAGSVDFNAASPTDGDTGNSADYEFVDGDEVTFVCWVYVEGLSYQHLFTKGAQGIGDGGYTVRIENTRTQNWTFWDVASDISTITATRNAWQFHCVAANIDSATGDVDHYIQDSSEASGFVSVPNASSNNLVIGRRKAGGSTLGLDGQGAYFGVFDTQLSAAQVQELRWNPFSVAGNCLSFWPCWGTAGNVDVQGSVTHDLTFTNANNSTNAPPVFFYGTM